MSSIELDDEGLPVGFADWYNRKFFGQHVDTARMAQCEEAWTAAIRSQSNDDAKVSKLVEQMFVSGNEIPVERITITRKQYEALCTTRNNNEQ